VEVRQVVGQVLASQHHIDGMRAIGRRLRTGCICQGPRCGHRLRNRADAADARHDDQRVSRVAAHQHLLETAVHGRVHLRLRHAAISDAKPHFQVAFNTVEGADDEAPCLLGFAHFSRVLRMAGVTTTWSAVAFNFTRLGVALLLSEASATNQALGMSVGKPMGMPASLGVT